MILVYTNCGTDAVDLSPSYPTERQFYQSQEDFESSIFGVYQKLQDHYRFVGSTDHFTVMLLAPDDNVKASDNNSFRSFNFFSGLNDSNLALERLYTLSYQLIYRSNTVLSKIDEFEDVYTDQSLANTHRAEASLLRGLTFMRLWHFFGTAPVVKSVFKNAGEAYNATNSSGTKLLDAAIEDFEYAARFLPISWPEQFLGRATAGAAYGFLGKALFFRGMVENNNEDLLAAISAFDQVAGYSLIGDFGANFDESMENNQESLFEVQLSENLIGLGIWLSADDGTGDLSGYWGMFNGKNRFWS
ncbi:MAG: RagB/SusD family nutrient uptake outer membrane protein [Cyclobacteriaceae bacterium]|nr:RagB/SusD family nutrient uptake outer membrane protein [Cyclobacteriaceae bacterium HetDA_MAG_MS6]